MLVKREINKPTNRKAEGNVENATGQERPSEKPVATAKHGSKGKIKRIACRAQTESKSHKRYRIM